MAVGGSNWTSGLVSCPDDVRFYYEEDCDEILETETLSGVVRRQSKYGSTSSHDSHLAKQKLLTHVVEPHDTLAGLALKYSVTIEQIRRANRMYTSDSLFCKSVLSIPVPQDAGPQNDLFADPVSTRNGAPPAAKRPSGVTGDGPPVTCDSHATRGKEDQSIEISNSPDSWSSPSLQMSGACDISLTKMNGKRPTSMRQQLQPQSTPKVPEESANDFLHRIDSSIAKTRDQLEKKAGASGVAYSYSENDLFSLNQPAASSVSRSRSARFKNSQADAGMTNGEPACYIRTGDNKVRYSMRRLEQEQDELFQL